MRTAGGITAAVAAAIVAFVLMIAIIVGSDNHNQAGSANGAALNTASLPASFTPWPRRAGALCQHRSAHRCWPRSCAKSPTSTRRPCQRPALKARRSFLPGTCELFV